MTAPDMRGAAQGDPRARRQGRRRRSAPHRDRRERRSPPVHPARHRRRAAARDDPRACSPSGLAQLARRRRPASPSCAPPRRAWTPERAARDHRHRRRRHPRARARARDDAARRALRPHRRVHAGVRRARGVAVLRAQRADRPPRRAGRPDVHDAGGRSAAARRRCSASTAASRAGRSRVSGKPEFGGELPVAALAEEIETPGDGQIRALITSAGNPVLSAPGGAAPRARARRARLHGLDRSVPQRDDAPRARDPAADVAARALALRRRAQRVRGAQRREVLAAAVRARAPTRATTGRSASRCGRG